VLCSLESPSLERGKKTHQKQGPFPPSKKKFLTLLRGGESNCIEHRPIIQVLAVVNTIATTTIMTVNDESCIFMFLFLSRRMGLGNRTSDFDCSIDLSCWATVL